MATTIGPNPVYSTEYQEGPSGFGAYRDQGRRLKLFKGEYLDDICAGPGDPFVLYVESGQIACSFHLCDNVNRLLFMRGDGTSLINENTPALRTLGTVRYTARRNSALVCFTRRQTYELIARDHNLFDELAAIEHRAFVQIAYRAALLDLPSASERILRWLADLGKGTAAQGVRCTTVPCNLTLEGMSDYLDVHITTLSRMLASLRERGLIERGKGYLTIKDIGEIERLLATEGVALY